MNQILILLFLGSLSLGQLGAVSLGKGITIYSHDVLLLILAGYMLVHLPKKLPRLTFIFPIVAFFGICLLSLLVNITNFSLQEIHVSVLYALRWGAYAFVYCMVLVSSVNSMTWLWGLYGSGTLISLFGLVQYGLYPSLRNLTYLGWDPHLYRLFSTFLDPNFAAMALVLTLILGQYVWQYAKHKAILVATQSLVLISLLLTYSRSGFLAFIIALGIMCIAYKKIRMGLIGIMLFVGVLFVLPQSGGEGVRLLRTTSSMARVGNWQRGMTLIVERPFFGYGFNTLRYVQQAHGWTDDSVIVSKASAGVDNSLQFIWATTGIIGFAIYIWLIVSIFSMGGRVLRHKNLRALGVLIIASLTSLLLHSQFSNSLFYPFMMIWMWIVIGAAQRLISSGK